MLHALTKPIAQHRCLHLPRTVVLWMVSSLLCLPPAAPILAQNRQEGDAVPGASAPMSDNVSPAAELPVAQQPPQPPLPEALDLRARDYPEPGGYSLPTAPSGASMQYLDLTGWFTPRQSRRLGLTLGVVSQTPGAAQRAVFDSAYAPGTPLAYDLGVRWQSELRPHLQLDLQAWARTHQYTGTQDTLGMIWNQHQNSTFGTRLEVQWTSRRAGSLVPEFGAIGVQLQSDSRLLLRVRRGGPMLYYRAKF